MMHVERVRRLEDLTPLRQRWDELAGPRVFCRSGWLWSWWQAYQDLGELYVLIVRDKAGEVCGIAPWYIERSLSQGATVKFLGSGKACSEYLTVLMEETNRTDVIQALANWLIESCHTSADGWDQFELQGGAADDTALAGLAAWLESMGAEVGQRSGPGCWVLCLPQTWDNFLSQLGKNSRRKTRKIRARWAEEKTLRAITSIEEVTLDTLFAHLVDMHQRRWAAVGVAGCFSDERFTRFLHEAAEVLQAEGHAMITGVEVDGRVGAATLLLRAGQSYFVYASGMDPTLNEQEPGWLLNVWNIDHAMRQNAATLDFLRGNERYKGDLSAEIVPQTDWRISAPHVLGRLRHRAWVTHTWLRDWGKSLLSSAVPTSH